MACMVGRFVLLVCACLTAVAVAYSGHDYNECDACVEMFTYWSKLREPVSRITNNWCADNFSDKAWFQGDPDYDSCYRAFTFLTTDEDTRRYLNFLLANGCDQENPCDPREACSLLTFQHSAGFCNQDVPRTDDEFVSIQSYTHPDHFVKHDHYLMEMSLLKKKDRKAATWKVVPGILGASTEHVSIASVDYPGYYLRHYWYRMVMAKPPETSEEDPHFLEQATFTMEPGLANRHWLSFQSVDFPGYFVRSRDFHLYLERETDLDHPEDATFRIVRPVYRPKKGANMMRMLRHELSRTKTASPQSHKEEQGMLSEMKQAMLKKVQHKRE